MKVIIRYALLILQIAFITVLVYQFENMEKYADEITVATKVEYIYYDDFEQSSDLYVDYNINKVVQDVWKIEEPLNYNRPVYVTLGKNKQGIHEVKSVMGKRPKQKNPNEVILKANYSNNDDKGEHYVYYGFESIQHAERFGRFKEGDQLLVTVLLGRLGQQKVVHIEKK